ncbi:hypothetical protein [Streptomyces sp. KL116D]|uniref:hypothetical protein n=1 Tax=Streptomyces sp. KL116D TaxID=3045152 RepID=UPI003558A0EC
MIGRPETGSYAVFPEEGAQALRMFADGLPVAEVADWYERVCGAPLDMDDFLETLSELGFLRTDEARTDTPTVRWQGLGRLLFGAPAWLAYGVVVAGAVTVMVHDPGLRPSYHQVFFTHYLSLIPITIFALAIPCIVIHEGFHALAGRRLGLPSTLGIGRRLYYLVAEARLDSLLSVERRKRYLPFCAGMLADVVLLCGLTLMSLALDGHGIPSVDSQTLSRCRIHLRPATHLAIPVLSGDRHLLRGDDRGPLHGSAERDAFPDPQRRTACAASRSARPGHRVVRARPGGGPLVRAAAHRRVRVLAGLARLGRPPHRAALLVDDRRPARRRRHLVLGAGRRGGLHRPVGPVQIGLLVHVTLRDRRTRSRPPRRPPKEP